MRAGPLAEALEYALEKQVPVHSLLIARHGVIVIDAAFYPYLRGTRHDLASVTKSVTSLLAGMTFADPGVRVLPLLGRRTQDARKDAISLDDLLAMRSGFDCGFSRGEPELRAMFGTPDWVQAIVDLPMRADPGRAFAYCSGNYHLISAAIRAASGLSAEALARERLFAPLGIEDVYWPADPQGVTRGWGDLQLRPRDLAKIGLLLLQGGAWDGRQIVPRAWIERTNTPLSEYDDKNFYGRGWWRHPRTPPGFYEAIGRGGQRLSIWPEKDLVAVWTGGYFEPGDFSPILLEAIAADDPLPADPAANARLARALVRAEAAPPPRAVISMPAIASRISGRSWRVGANELGITEAAFQFGNGAEARAKLTLAGHVLDLPIGLDGVYRVAPEPFDGVPPAARGSWTGDAFVLDVNLVGRIDRFLLTFRFAEDRVELQVRRPD